MARSKPDKRMDDELLRIQGIHRLLDEAVNRLYKMRRQLGEYAFYRALRYLRSRESSLVFDLAKRETDVSV